MKDISDVLKNLQKVSESLGQLHITDGHPWKMISQMHQMFDTHFWDNIAQLTTKFTGEQKQKEEDDVNIEHTFTPNIDVFQTRSKIIVSCEVPGLDMNTLEYSLANSRKLLIKGKIREHQYNNYSIRKERFSGNFERKITLPHPASSAGIRTSYQAGLLELHFVKKSGNSVRKRKSF